MCAQFETPPFLCFKVTNEMMKRSSTCNALEDVPFPLTPISSLEQTSQLINKNSSFSPMGNEIAVAYRKRYHVLSPYENFLYTLRCRWVIVVFILL
jgi:hypothetical protein